MPMKEIKDFEPDPKNYTTSDEKNDRLIDLLNGPYHDEDLVLIERIEITDKGWRFTYRRP